MTHLQELIQQNFVHLTESLDVQDFINTCPSSLCIYDYEHLRAMNRMDRNYDFLLNIQRFGTAVGQQFASWLDQQGFKHTANTSTPVQPSGDDQARIRRRLVLLTRNMNANADTPPLFQDGYLNKEEVERIYIHPTRKERTHHLLTMLISRHRKPGLLNSFTKALRMYQPHLCEEFMKHIE